MFLGTLCWAERISSVNSCKIAVFDFFCSWFLLTKTVSVHLLTAGGTVIALFLHWHDLVPSFDPLASNGSEVELSMFGKARITSVCSVRRTVWWGHHRLRRGWWSFQLLSLTRGSSLFLEYQSAGRWWCLRGKGPLPSGTVFGWCNWCR